MADEPKQECEHGCEPGKCEGDAAPNGIQVSEKAKSLKDAVSEAISNSGPVVMERVKEQLVEEEVQKRTDLILKGLARKTDLEDQLAKMKPEGPAGYDKEGKVVVAATFTKAQIEQLKKLTGQLNGIEKALENALVIDKPCFKKLRETVGK